MGRPPGRVGNGNGNGRPGNGNGNGRPPGNGRPEHPPKQKPKTRKGRRGHAAASLLKLLEKPGQRPNRKAIEAHLKNVEKFTDKQVQDSLVDMYDRCVELGVLRARRS